VNAEVRKAASDQGQAAQAPPVRRTTIRRPDLT
jgi:hypothetical protein